MFDDAKTIQRMAPRLQRVLIVDPSAASARMMADLMRNLVQCQVWIAPDTRKGLALTESVGAQIVFVELSGPGVDGVEFTRKLRRSTVPCRQAPVVVTTATATAQAILGARDAGVHEFLRKPFTTKDLLRRLEAVTLRQRDWIEAVAYIGPDRRRFNSGDYSGPLKRRSDTEKTTDAARIDQALKILRSAVAAVASDPIQALRAMQAQAVDLQKAAVSISDPKLAAATADFQRYLAAVAARSAPFSAQEVATQAASLLALLPDDPDARTAAA